MKKIDCHTHIVTAEIRDAYFARTDGWALVMQMPESLMQNPDCVRTVRSDPRLFLCACIDLKKAVEPQLRQLEAHLDEWKVVGLKLYLTYQRGRADEPRLFPVYRFAAAHRLTVTFHTGLCSLVLPSDGDMEGSRACYVARAAEAFPQVNFVIAHMDDPRFDECVRLVAGHDNLYTDFSGAYETGTKEGGDVEGAIRTFGSAIHACAGMERKILYGTDFCPLLNMAQLEEYDLSLERIFDREALPLVYRENCLRAFPRLRDDWGGTES